ncbi:hypothetical protein ACFL0I_01260 [Gemmatimonadota bacterium]
MRNRIKTLVVGSLLLFGGAACADLEVINYGSADAARALATPGDVESLIAGSMNSWFGGVYSYNGPGPFISNAAFHHNAPWSNFSMEIYGRLPRVALENTAAGNGYGNFTRPWFYSYRAIAALADGLRALEDPIIAEELGPDAVARLKAYGKFTQALSHATVAMFFDRGFLVTSETDLTEAQEMLDYNALMTEALAQFDEAIGLCSTSFTIPWSWMGVEISNTELAKVAHSYKARFRAQVARTEAERAAVNWGAVTSDINAGITETYLNYWDWDNGFYNSTLYYGSRPDWGQLAYFVYGMADQSGLYQDWLALDLGQKNYEKADGTPYLITTPDLRFPRGSTVEDQQATDSTGLHVRINTPDEAGGTWKRPDRGTWRWSWYKTSVGEDYRAEANWWQPEIQHAEMRLLLAEALFRANDLAGAAAIINETRVPAGLNAADAAGTNTSCVPKLPNGSCGNLWEQLKWEKRLETMWTGLAIGNWWFDGRGWGDLYKDTPYQFPVPCQELEVLQMLPCNTFGGPGGESAAPTSNYAYPHEG